MDCTKTDCVARGTIACKGCVDYSNYTDEPADKEDYYGGR